MTAEQLAEKMYMAWRRDQHDPTAHPSWGNVDADGRRGWVAAAKVAIESVSERIAAWIGRQQGLSQRETDLCGFAADGIRAGDWQ